MGTNEPSFPGNTLKDRSTEPDKKIERITSEAPIRRKKSLTRRIRDVVIGNNPKATASFIVQSVLLPASKDMIIDAVREGVERLVRGESYRRRSAGPSGYVSYNRASPSPPRNYEPTRSFGRPGQRSPSFDDIVLQSRTEADQVIERMFDIVGRYDSVTVSDLYDLVGIKGSHVDHKWGWTDIRGAEVVRIREGFLLDLPDVQPMAM